MEEEGMEFQRAFTEAFASRENMTKRLQAERRSNMTPAQRNRRGPPRTQVNFRATAQTRQLLDGLIEQLGLGQTEVIERAIAAYAQLQTPKGAKK